jgi:hypothetical protein
MEVGLTVPLASSIPGSPASRHRRFAGAPE